MKTTKRKILLIIITVLVVAVIGWGIASRGSDTNYDFIVASPSDVIEKINVTGRVVPTSDVSIAFERSGTLQQVFVAVGDIVGQGQVLATLRNNELRSNLLEAEAQVRFEQAKLNELLKGTRAEEIQIAETKLINARILLQEAETSIIDALEDSFTVADDILRNDIRQLYTNAQSVNVDFSPEINSAALETELENRFLTTQNTIKNWQTLVSDISPEDDLSDRIQNTKAHLQNFKTFLERIALALSNIQENTSISQTTIDGWKTGISSARSAINASTGALSTTEEKYRNASSNVRLAEVELDLTKAETRDEQISAQEAQVARAEANVLQTQAQIDNTILRAPIGGIITKNEAEVGETVNAGGEPLISIISVDTFEIEAFIPEADIAQVVLGDEATVTLDAYGDNVLFTARVVAIEPAETIIEGVPTYKTTLQFTEQDERIRSGMTANIEIETERRESVVAIPFRALVPNGGNGTIVRVLNNEEMIIEIPVVVGLRGFDGSVEIIEGIEEGDRVIVFLEE